MNYVIQPGDTLSAIAARFGTTVAALVAANGIADPDKIIVGVTINIPVTAAPVVPTPTPTVTAPGGTVTAPVAPGNFAGGMTSQEAAAVVDAYIAAGLLQPAQRNEMIAAGVVFETQQQFSGFLDQVIAAGVDSSDTGDSGSNVTVGDDVPTGGGGGGTVGTTSGGGHFVTVNFITNDGSAGQANIFFPSAVWTALLASPLADKYGLNQADPVITLGQFANFKKDVQTSISGPLLVIANEKLNALNSVAADANSNVPPVSPEMANSGIAWAIDPVSGLPELIDTKPFFGPPVSSFQYIPIDPNNPSQGGSWTLVATDDTKSIFEGVPSSVRGWLQLALDAGGDTSVVPAGAARAWVAFILGQASNSSSRPPTELPFGFGLPEFEGGRPGASIVAPDSDMFGTDAPVIPVPDEVVGEGTPNTEANTGGVTVGNATDDAPPAVVAAPIVPPDTGTVTPPSPTVTPPTTFPLPGESDPSFPLPPPSTPLNPTPVEEPVVIAPTVSPGFDPLSLPDPTLPPPPIPTPSIFDVSEPLSAPAPPEPVFAFDPDRDQDDPFANIAPELPPTISLEMQKEQLTLQILIDTGAPPIVIAAQQTKIDSISGR